MQFLALLLSSMFVKISGEASSISGSNRTNRRAGSNPAPRKFSHARVAKWQTQETLSAPTTRVVSGWIQVQDVPRKFGIVVVVESSARVELRQSRV